LMPYVMTETKVYRRLGQLLAINVGEHGNFLFLPEIHTRINLAQMTADARSFAWKRRGWKVGLDCLQLARASPLVRILVAQ